MESQAQFDLEPEEPLRIKYGPKPWSMSKNSATVHMPVNRVSAVRSNSAQAKYGPWNVVLQPPLACQTKSEWHRQREAQRDLRRAQLNEASDTAAHDKEIRASPEPPKRQHVFNIHPEPGSVADYHSNRQLQVEQPLLYGPYLPEGESYQTPRTAENVNKACAAAGLDELPERHRRCRRLGSPAFSTVSI